MNLFTKIVLKCLSIVTVFLQVVFAFAGLVLLFATVALLFVPNDVKNQLLQYLDLNTNVNITMVLVLSSLVAFLIIACLFIIMHALRKMIGNIYKQNFFVPQNLTYLKLILISITSITILQFISQVFFAKLHAYNVSNVFSNSASDLVGNILLLAIVYTLYVVFKYGISLQDDSNNVI
ncbi:DUF2975 domain-containing protein [Rummeliibacillus sp. POC4]|uniref:DUF2975 domain-containing protein n=1 Tax=Rummeliibacillus sp. POC4 TaxID=2305899 RepID=UPI000E66B5F5|nr:DUF2975 domain-containing protein [Rummeliibacillus sp. POC4]RIJ63757.1 DUF2975 domain-containing protein [Rummeliibacillus sp. POC4]